MDKSTEFEYSGNELEVFALAKNWRKYWMEMIRGFLGNEVLEVGAGIGTIMESLKEPNVKWTALEPDGNMFETLKAKCRDTDSTIEVLCTTLQDFSAEERFDSILYFDVLEHINDDALEVELAFSKLKPEGFMVILVPAHQSLFSPFDKEIGHFRRYDLKTLGLLMPDNARPVFARYLDSSGYFLSWANSKLLRQKQPSASQVLFWDTFVIPVSRIADRVLRFRFGKSLLAVWQAYPPSKP